MVKSLRSILPRMTKMEVEQSPQLSAQKMAEKAFIDSHTVQAWPDRNGNGDEVFKGTVKKAEGDKPDVGYKEEPHTVKEDVEQIDELSKKTLKSYVRKAGTSEYRNDKKGEKEEDKSMSTDGTKYPEKQERHQRNATAAYTIAQRRREGIKKASEKLKEDVEQINELTGKGQLTKITAGHHNKAFNLNRKADQADVAGDEEGAQDHGFAAHHHQMRADHGHALMKVKKAMADLKAAKAATKAAKNEKF